MIFKNIDCTKKEAHLAYENWKLRNQFKYEELLSRRCELCDNESHCLHHKDGDRRSNFHKNLQPLCRSCHFKEHNVLKVSYVDTKIDYYSLFKGDNEVVEKIKRWKRILDIEDESEIIRRLILNFRF